MELPIRSKTQEIPQRLLGPYYTQDWFKVYGGRTIFLAEDAALITPSGVERVEGARYAEAGTMRYCFDTDQVAFAERAAAQQVGNTNTATYFEAMLQQMYQRPAIRLLHLVVGIDVNNGHPYQAFGMVGAPSNLYTSPGGA